MLKINTFPLGGLFLLTPDSENHSRFTVNSERIIVKPKFTFMKPAKWHSEIFTMIEEMTGEMFWHQQVWHAVFKTEAFQPISYLAFSFRRTTHERKQEI